MRFAFSDEQIALRDAVRDLLAKECPPAAVRAAWTNDSGRCPSAWAALTEMGVLGVVAPEAVGGLGLDRGRPRAGARGDGTVRAPRADRRDRRRRGAAARRARRSSRCRLERGGRARAGTVRGVGRLGDGSRRDRRRRAGRARGAGSRRPRAGGVGRRRPAAVHDLETRVPSATGHRREVEADLALRPRRARHRGAARRAGRPHDRDDGRVRDERNSSACRSDRSRR